MTNTQIRLFVQLAESGSFTKAGEALNMTQPAVSRAISALEEELDVKLLVRDRRNGPMLTGIGKRILVIFREILHGFEKLEQEIGAERGLEKGHIRIGAFPVAAAHFVPKLISTITASYPGITFSLREGSISEIREWMETRAIDVGLVLAPQEGFTTFPLLREKLFAVLPAGHRLAGQEIIRVKDLEDEPMLLCRSGYEPPVVDLFRRGDARMNVRFEVNSYMTSLHLIKEGLAVGVMSELSLKTVPEGLVIRGLTPDAYRDIHLAVHSLEESSLAVRLCVDTALGLFAEHSATVT